MGIDNNKSSFEFFQSIYKQGIKEINQYVRLLNARKFLYFRIYSGGNYLAFSNDLKYIKHLYFQTHENPPIFMDFVQSTSSQKANLCIAPYMENDSTIKLFYELGWQNHCINYHRHKNYVDCLTFSWDKESNPYDPIYLNKNSLFKSLYWIVREKLNDLIPYDQPGVLSQFRNGADISYKPPENCFQLPELEKKIQWLLEDLSRQKLSFTPREWEVCKGLARGETAKETARVLGYD